MSAFPIPAAALAHHTILLGKTRAGKSSAMRGMVEQLLDAQKPVCILDPKGDWWGLKSSRDGKRPGYPVIIFGGEHADVPINAHSGAQVAELVATGNRPAIVDFGGWMVGERTRFFIDFAAAFFRHARGPRHLVIDEVHNFAPQGKVHDPDAGKMVHWANRLASEGAGKGITLISASQRPQKVHKDYVTSHETLIAMRVIHPLDRGAIKDWIDGCPDRELGRQVMDELASMPRGEGWAWSPEAGFGPVRVKFPMFASYDSFAAPTSDAPQALKGWATVDLAEVRAKLAAALEEAKARDPAVLKAEVARLTRELTAARARPELDSHGPRVRIAALEREAEELKRVGDALYQRGIVIGLGRAEDAIGPLIVAANADPEAPPLDDETLAFIASRAKAGAEPAAHDEAVAAEPVSRPAAGRSAAAGAEKMAPPKPPATPRRVLAAEGLTGPQQHLLRALAWWAVMGHPRPTRVQLAAIAGWKPRGSNLRNRLSELSAQGLVEYPAPGAVALTEAGHAAAPFPDLATTLLDSIRAVLTEPQRRIFEQLLGSGITLRRGALAERLGWEAGGSNLRNRLSELSALGLIEYPAPGEVRLQSWVTG